MPGSVWIQCPLQDGLALPFFYLTRVTLNRGRQSVTPSRHNDLINRRLERVVLAWVTQYVSGLYCLSLSMPGWPQYSEGPAVLPGNRGAEAHVLVS